MAFTSGWQAAAGFQIDGLIHKGHFLLGLAQRLQVDSQLLAFLVEVAALQPQRPGNVRHVEIVAPNFRKHHFPFERFGAFRQRAR